MMKLTLLISSLALAVAQNPANSPENLAERFPGIDPELIVNPPEGLDLEGCFDDLMTADLDGSGAIEKDEYLNFINVYGERICWYQEELTLEQHGAFNSLACMCEAQEGNDASCCLLDNAKLPTTNARTPDLRTNEELLWMTVTCVVTDGLLEHLCTPFPKERDIADPLIWEPQGGWVVVGETLEDGSIWAIIMGLIGLLLLVCLCCCCCAASKTTKMIEEEEDDEDVQMIPPAMKEAPSEQAPGERDMEQAIPIVAPPMEEEEEIMEEEEEQELPPGEQVEITEEIIEVEEGVGVPAVGANYASDEEEGEGRRGRGSNYVDEEPDDGIPRWGAPRLPPPEDPEPDPIRLKPFEKDPNEPDEWDYPNREILESKNKSEMEGQTFDPYIPDGGVARDDRQPKDPLQWKNEWERSKKPEEDEVDHRKHRIQSGLAGGEVWDRVNEPDVQSQSIMTGGGDVFDWVVSSALGVLNKADEAPADDSSA